MIPDSLDHPPRRALQMLALALLPAALALGGCSQSDAGNTPVDFSLEVPEEGLLLVEGDADGLSIPLALERRNDHAAPVSLAIEGASAADVASLSGSFASPVLEAGDDATRVTLHLDIADRSILPGQRRLRLVANDGRHTTRSELVIDVEPVDAPDVYLLLGQSNMVGASGEGTRQAEPGGPDEPDPRLIQLNVSSNDPSGAFGSAAAYTSPEDNVVAPSVIVAEDPLHEPANPDGVSGKGFASIGLGLTFGKRALEATSREVVLVPAAWSSSAFCDNEDAPPGQWNALPSDEAVLGNTLLFERALVRADAALAETGGILRGILWHQGESDANLPCATLYAENLALLAGELRRRIAPDARGPALRASDAPIPFVVGTMSRGADERGDYSVFSEAKRLVDEAHRDVAARIPHSAVSIHDDLVPAIGYPCGQQDCIHFGAAALREMGLRYHDALVRSLAER